MEKTTHKLFHGDTLMIWGKGTVVKGAPGLIFLAGTEGLVPDEDFSRGGRVVEGAAAQTRLALEKIKSRLEEMGSSLENIVKLTWYVVGEFPDGVVNHPNFRFDVWDQFWRENCPTMASDCNPPTHDLIGVSGLGIKGQVVEIACVAVLPED
ncbi:MAG: RidA family protein [Actinobacteria bacterium]|nr:RidA family protein [Actinomycetota bacterium]